MVGAHLPPVPVWQSISVLPRQQYPWQEYRCIPRGQLRAPKSASQTLGTQAGLEWGRRAPIQSVDVEPALHPVSLGWFPEPGGPGNAPDMGDNKVLHGAVARFHLHLHNSLEKFHPLPFLIS